MFSGFAKLQEIGKLGLFGRYWGGILGESDWSCDGWKSDKWELNDP